MRNLLLPLVLSLCFACSRTETDAADDVRAVPPLNSLDLVRGDMTEPHVALPSGVLDREGWKRGPRVGYGNTPTEGWNAFITWGQVYKAAGSTVPDANTRFQIRNLQAHYLSKADGQWHRLQQTDAIGGANYAEDFQNDLNVAADLRANAEGYSATLRPGYNFHFWPSEGRMALPDSADIAGVWVSIEARLVKDDPAGVDNRGKVRWMMSAGADYWQDRETPWDQWKTNGDVGIGRFRWITKDWQAYNMHTLTDEQLRANPPPL